MNRRHHFTFARMLAGLLVLFPAAILSHAQTSAFTYQGKLVDNSSPANGSYDFQFKLFDALTGGTQQGSTITVNGVTVTGGIFTVNLDFGGNFPGTERFLEISVKQTSGSTFTMLSPRQQVTSTPYAIRSLNTATADGLSIACVGCVTSSQIQSVQGSQITGTIPVVSIPAGSGNYIQNTTSQQPSSNFNISGDGTLGGTLSGNMLNSTTQYNIGGARVLSVAGTQNTFAGIGAGNANTTGPFNSFYGFNAGFANTSGGDNSFFGFKAGHNNTTGVNNSFFGKDAGFANTTANANSFFGVSAGTGNTTGTGNSFFGFDAGSVNTTANNNSFFGLFAGASNTTAGNNSFFGTSAGVSNTGGVNDSFFGVNAGFSNTTGFSNVFAGDNAGAANTTGFNNAFFGSGGGSNNTTGSNNTLIGFGANVPSGSNLTFAAAIGSGATVSTSNTIVLGRAAETVQVPGTLAVTGTLSSDTVNAATQFNINNQRVLSLTGTENLFAGLGAGQANTTGAADAFFGNNAGFANTTGVENSFFGDIAGLRNTTGSVNSFFGFAAGFGNTSGGGNSFFGGSAGVNNTTGSGNSFFGEFAGNANTIGGNNSFFGALAGNSSTGDSNSFFGTSAGVSNTTGADNAFFGSVAGQLNTTGSNNAFFGTNSGRSNTTANANSFFGMSAGEANTTGAGNSFFGSLVGSSNTTGSNMTLVGSAANVGGDGLSNATAIGANASVASNNSLVLGSINGVNGATADTNVGIGTTSPAARLHVVGNVFITGTLQLNGLGFAGSTTLCRNISNQIAICSSSLRYKTDLHPFVGGLDLIKQLRPITFKWKTDQMLDVGLGAEDVALVEPLLVTRNEKGEVEGVKYERLGVVLINAVREQQAQIEQQHKQIESLRKLVCQGHPNADVCR